jgi:hypothetical protein
VVIMPDNAFLTQANRNQLAAAGVVGPSSSAASSTMSAKTAR